MKHHKQPERRTFNQDRFDILIKRQKNGTATFNELTELDEIVNRDHTIRESVLFEMQGDDTTTYPYPPEEIPPAAPQHRRTFADKFRSFLDKLFINRFNKMLIVEPMLAARG